MLPLMAARVRSAVKAPDVKAPDKNLDKKPLERLHERIVMRDRGWFFANIADKVAERRVEKNLSQRQAVVSRLAIGTTKVTTGRLDVAMSREIKESDFAVVIE